jgi:hypothetical protein
LLRALNREILLARARTANAANPATTAAAATRFQNTRDAID